MRVKSRESDKVVETYAFPDGGSNISFCTDNLLKRLNVKGKMTILALTILEKDNSKTHSSVVSLEIFDLQENHLIELPPVFSVTKLPVTK